MPRNTLPIFACAISHGSSIARDAAEDLRHREHADHDRDQGQPAGELGVAEGEAREPRRVVEADRGDEQAEQQRHDALQRIGERDEHGAQQAQ